ncbi:MAG: glycosyl hydrolase [Acidimicrobiales bacterium]
MTSNRGSAVARSSGGAAGALILSGSIGRGHDSVAEACRAAFAAASVPATVLDCMSMLGGTGSRAGTAAFRHMISVPSVYDAFHFGHLRAGTWLPRILERAAVRQVLPEVRAEVGRLKGGPTVVSVFPTGVSAAAALKREDPSLTTVAVCTDACAHRMWVAEGTDLYVVCSPLAAVTVRRYAPDATIAVVPPPVRPPFFEALSKDAARERLGIPADAPCVLLMAGGWGLGPLAETASALGEAGYFVLAVAGTNRRLQARLDAVARRCWRVVPFGMTDRVPELMAAADSVVTSSGQTCHEARVVGRWLVILDVVPGHGRENTLHELEKGAAFACSPDPGSVVSAVRLIFREQPEHPPWPVRSTAEWEKHFFAALGMVGIEEGEPAHAAEPAESAPRPGLGTGS